MKFNLENLNPGTFFPFKDEDGEGGVTVRLANSELLSELTKKCTKKRYEFRKGQRFEIIDEDSDLRANLLWDYVVVDWKGITDEKDNTLECTPENKTKLMRGSVVFSSFVGNCVSKLSKDAEEEEELLEKNL